MGRRFPARNVVRPGTPFVEAWAFDVVSTRRGPPMRRMPWALAAAALLLLPLADCKISR